MLRRIFRRPRAIGASRLGGAGALVALLPLLATPALAAQSAQDDPYGNWTGRLVTDRGSCPDQTDSVLQIQSDRLVFSPGTGALTLRGRPDADHKRFHAQLKLTDASRRPLPMVFEGHPDGNTIAGVFGTPTCRAHIVMTRTASHPWSNLIGR
ncbi:hypothetical protein AA23498_2008 [Acetobacter nitrogenifigens DSM 23921 = NBRC 105050]|uniref:Uncharacterized protein n=1 Tax=Acetobacter nitrogenifigens DSM 23921 = NBRC 105050 TaxID=1120919 RepID=A0A511XFD8_9PROT|nr:hypothetical protein [Acetobacter nitrogenifigens]GBQ94371.1 hypothetical protein AA23498_2008 [Acetobacter nitrogenifigens DSM 23921 = NBRC 105050]GEN61611.1 hypothetical protein ANI02nite_34950 [Acetobacter nitrogenifigens DSM 23921 = NBRC 105050]